MRRKKTSAEGGKARIGHVSMHARTVKLRVIVKRNAKVDSGGWHTSMYFSEHKLSDKAWWPHMASIWPKTLFCLTAELLPPSSYMSHVTAWCSAAAAPSHRLSGLAGLFTSDDVIECLPHANVISKADSPASAEGLIAGSINVSKTEDLRRCTLLQ